MLTPLQSDAQALWKQRFRIPALLSSRVAPTNPTRTLVCAHFGEVIQLYAWERPSNALRQLSHEPCGALVGAIPADGRYVYYPTDPDGDQYGHIVRVPFAGGPMQDLAPDLPPYPCGQVCVSATGNMLAIPLPRPQEQGTDLYVIALGDEVVGVPRHLFHDPIAGLHGRKRLLLSADGSLLIFASDERTPTTVARLLAFDTHTGTLVGEFAAGAGAEVSLVDIAPLPDDRRVLVLVHRGEVLDAVLWDPQRGTRMFLEWALDGLVLPVTWSPDGVDILLHHRHALGERFVLAALADGDLRPSAYLEGTIVHAVCADHDTVLVHLERHRPAEIVALDMATGAPGSTALSGGPYPAERSWISITYPSSDGEVVQAWLIAPEGTGPFPTVLYIHGGPHDSVEQGHAPDLQAWVDHGIAVFAPNYRGSTGVTRAFQDKIYGEPGHWEMEDIIAGRAWLVAQGIARPEAILIGGWSYGGYLTLLALGRYPDLWVGGMAGYAIADFGATDEQVGDGLAFTWLFGGTPQERPEQYRQSSPITYAANITAPVFIYQGRHDVGCPSAQMEQYVARLRELGKQVEIVWLEAAHGTLQIEQGIAIQEMLLEFALRTLAATGG